MPADPPKARQTGLQALTRELRAQPPASLASVDDEHLRQLAHAIRAARHQQAAELARAGDKALNLVPRLLRGPVRRVLGS